MAHRLSKSAAPTRFCPGSRHRSGLLLALAISLPSCATPRQGSIGAVLSRDRQSGAVHVRETPSNQAAAKAGLLPGDRLKMVDGQLLDPMLTKDVQGLLRGTIGSSIQLTVLRGREVIHIALTRGPVTDGDHVAPRKKILKD